MSHAIRRSLIIVLLLSPSLSFTLNCPTYGDFTTVQKGRILYNDLIFDAANADTRDLLKKLEKTKTDHHVTTGKYDPNQKLLDQTPQGKLNERKAICSYPDFAFQENDGEINKLADIRLVPLTPDKIKQN